MAESETTPAPVGMTEGEEQRAFEEWAAVEGMDLRQHPLHYLFLSGKTYAARLGWNAALSFARRAILAAAAPATGEREADGQTPLEWNCRCGCRWQVTDKCAYCGALRPRHGEQQEEG